MLLRLSCNGNRIFAATCDRQFLWLSGFPAPAQRAQGRLRVEIMRKVLSATPLAQFGDDGRLNVSDLRLMYAVVFLLAAVPPFHLIVDLIAVQDKDANNFDVVDSVGVRPNLNY